MKYLSYPRRLFAFVYFSGNRVTQKVVDFGDDANHDADTGIFDKQFTVAEFFVQLDK